MITSSTEIKPELLQCPDSSPTPKRQKLGTESDSTESKINAVLEKFGFPSDPHELGLVFDAKCEELYDRFVQVEEIKKPTLGMLARPSVLVKSLVVNDVVARSLGILEFGQQKPDWYDRMSQVWEDFGELSEYDASNMGTLARGSYVITYSTLDNHLKSMKSGIDEAKIDRLAKLLFYVDSFITIKSEPSYQSRIAITLFELHTFVRKIDLAVEEKEYDNRDVVKQMYGVLGITSESPRDHLFLDADCDGIVWTEDAFEKVQNELIVLIEAQGWDKIIYDYQDLKTELAARIASYHEIIDAE